MNRRDCLAILLALGLAACGSARQVPPGAEQPVTRVRVENQSYLDMVIYLIAGAQRIRLGTAGGNATTSFRIPPQYVFGVSSLQFLADPIGSNRTPISDTITVAPGDEIRLVIPPT